MVVKSRYSKNLKENPNKESTYRKEVKLQKEIERSIAVIPPKAKAVKETTNINLFGDKCLCCEQGCVCCEHPSGTVGHRCECTCVH